MNARIPGSKSSGTVALLGPQAAEESVRTTADRRQVAPAGNPHFTSDKKKPISPSDGAGRRQRAVLEYEDAEFKVVSIHYRARRIRVSQPREEFSDDEHQTTAA